MREHFKKSQDFASHRHAVLTRHLLHPSPPVVCFLNFRSKREAIGPMGPSPYLRTRRHPGRDGVGPGAQVSPPGQTPYSVARVGLTAAIGRPVALSVAEEVQCLAHEYLVVLEDAAVAGVG